MALCPFADHKLIEPGPNDPTIEAVGAILHVDDGNASTLYPWFSGPSGGIESHFFIKKKKGRIEQYRDTRYEADANLNGNSFYRGGRRVGFVSIETQGYEDGEWTPEQLDSIKDLLAWLSEVENFPLRDNRAWDDPGVAYHVKYGAPGAYTNVSKTCPGPKRIRQYENVLIPWMESGGDDMPLSKRDLDRIEERIWGRRLKPFKRSGDKGWKDGKRRADYLLRETHADAACGSWLWDGIPVPATGYSKEYREENPTFTGKFALSHDWGASEQGRLHSAGVAGQLSALTEAVQQLASGQGLDVEAVQRAAEEGVNRALADYTLNLEVEKTDQP